MIAFFLVVIAGWFFGGLVVDRIVVVLHARHKSIRGYSVPLPALISMAVVGPLWGALLGGLTAAAFVS